MCIGILTTFFKCISGLTGSMTLPTVSTTHIIYTYQKKSPVICIRWDRLVVSLVTADMVVAVRILGKIINKTLKTHFY